MNNIHINWLQSLHSKTHKDMKVFTHKKFVADKQEVPFGVIVNHLIPYSASTVLEQKDVDSTPKFTSLLELQLLVPKQDIMQYLIQWQRYRKYWWSSITTTPSLFVVNETKYEDETTEAEILAQFPGGHHTVETISSNSKSDSNSSLIKCSLTLENALFVLLLDGLQNTGSKFLRLHRNMAPYKISFALQTEENTNKSDLNRLATLMHSRLQSKDISAYIPDFTHTFEQQVQENLQLGVNYTAILFENTLKNGVFHLLNSDTMLKEEAHVADFDSYADLLCKSS